MMKIELMFNPDYFVGLENATGDEDKGLEYQPGHCIARHVGDQDN